MLNKNFVVLTCKIGFRALRKSQITVLWAIFWAQVLNNQCFTKTHSKHSAQRDFLVGRLQNGANYFGLKFAAEIIPEVKTYIFFQSQTNVQNRPIKRSFLLLTCEQKRDSIRINHKSVEEIPGKKWGERAHDKFPLLRSCSCPARLQFARHSHFNHYNESFYMAIASENKWSPGARAKRTHQKNSSDRKFECFLRLTLSMCSQTHSSWDESNLCKSMPPQQKLRESINPYYNVTRLILSVSPINIKPLFFIIYIINFL